MSDSGAELQTDDATIAWDARGEGPWVLLVHGVGSSRRRWESLQSALAAAGFRALRYDLRGFGASTSQKPAWGMAELLADARALLDHLRIESVHVVGHSLGGMVSQKLALSEPERTRSLVLASTTSHNGQRATAFSQVMQRFAEHTFDGVMNDPVARAELAPILAAAFPDLSEPPLGMLRIGMDRPNPGRANAWRACAEFSAKDELPKLTCPVLVMHGSADPLIPFRAGELVKAAIPQAEWREEPGAGHSLPSERAESFNAAVVDFLRRVEGRRTPRRASW